MLASYLFLRIDAAVILDRAERRLSANIAIIQDRQPYR
jgi:hypothetical protein